MEDGTPQDYITNAYLFYDLTLLAKVFHVLGRTAEAGRYGTLAEQAGVLTHKAFYSPATNRYSSGSQMAQGTALHFGFVPASERNAVFADLVSQIETLGHLDVGFLRASYVTAPSRKAVAPISLTASVVNAWKCPATPTGSPR